MPGAQASPATGEGRASGTDTQPGPGRGSASGARSLGSLHPVPHAIISPSHFTAHGQGSGRGGGSWEKGTADRRGRGTPGPQSHSDVSGLSSLTEQSYKSFSSAFQLELSPRSQILGPWEALGEAGSGTILREKGVTQMGQLERFGVVGRPWEGCRGSRTCSEGPQGSAGGRGLCPGCGSEPAWQAHLQEGWPVASHPVL